MNALYSVFFIVFFFSVEALFKSKPSVNNCTLNWYNQTLDHFSYISTTPFPTTFSQRYYTYDKYWRSGPNGTTGPIFFYTGNEGPVEAYVNSCGLMWENAEQLGALLVFAEHRYYGQTQPCGPDSYKKCPNFLTVEQALADYATLIYYLKKQLNAESSPVISFGGSYGGMLTAWMRMKYPSAIEGGIAASAPIWGYPGMSPPYDPKSYWKVVTHCAEAEGGPYCPKNIQLAIAAIFEQGQTSQGRETLTNAFKLCQPLNSTDDVENLAYWIQGAYDSLAMGDYPFPSDYIGGNAQHPMPAWPMRLACKPLQKELVGIELLSALSDSVSVLYNITQDQKCYSLDQTGPANGAGAWDWQYCTEAMPQEVPYFASAGPPNDMFWLQTSWPYSRIVKHCQDTWGVTPRPQWLDIQLNGHHLDSFTNIVFSNGGYDPWSSGGVLKAPSSSSLVTVFIPEGAHHLDLMFSDQGDPASVIVARQIEVENIKKWVNNYYKNNNKY